jgi:hypothetical protein
MGIYQDQVLPRVIDAVMNRREFAAIRGRVCSGLEGEVLEIGLGQASIFCTIHRLLLVCGRSIRRPWVGGWPLSG